MADYSEFLRKVPIFSELSDEDLRKVCSQVREVSLQAGRVLFSEGSNGRHAYVIQNGLIEVYKTSNGQPVQLAIRQRGDVVGEISLLESAPRTASVRAITDSVLLEISHTELDELLNTNPSATRTMLTTIINRLRSTELLLRQSDKMAQLGILTAGIAHELNNPSAAVRRGADHLRNEFQTFRSLMANFYTLGLSSSQVEEMKSLDAHVRKQAHHAPQIDALERDDLEVRFEEWLEEIGVDHGWEIAPQLANLELSPAELSECLSRFPGDGAPALLKWMATSYKIYCMLDEVGQGAGRISEIVKALKAYIYLDQGPIQEIDIHEGLENTLVILRHKMKKGIEIRREYAKSMPKIQAYGSELNQVWTNLIDNAVDAIGEKGVILIRTSHKDGWVTVEIIDDGPGIPEEIQPKLFTPFFTTKPMGKGTGLGLNISYNIINKHGGKIHLHSKPGNTRFIINVPVDFQQIQKEISEHSEEDWEEENRTE